MTDVMTNLMSPSPTGVDATEDLTFVWRWLLLGGAAGGWAGFLIGGVGGRLAMFVLRVTSSDSVRGIQSDDDFTIGRISSASAFLLGITTIMGLFVGVVLVVARSQLPGLSGAALIVLAAGTLGAGAIIKPDGVDFTRLAPLPLACAMFTVIPVAAASLILWLVARWRVWWWQKRGRTALASLPWIIAVPIFFVSIPFVLVALGVGVAFLRVHFLRQVATGQVGRVVATVVALVVIAFASVGLLSDIAEIV
jgi:hypothetical protein